MKTDARIFSWSIALATVGILPAFFWLVFLERAVWLVLVWLWEHRGAIALNPPGLQRIRWDGAEASAEEQILVEYY
jgi:hypothetical protein